MNRRPSLGQPIECRRFETLGAEAADVAVAQIVAKDDHDVWRRRFAVGGRGFAV